VALVGFAPWSAFLGWAGWFALGKRAAAEDAGSARYRFLWCWVVVYVVFFSLAATKLPNYILPIYAPLAILTARFLERWRGGLLRFEGWKMRSSLICLALMGLAVTVGLLVAAGRIELAPLHGRQLAGLDQIAGLGLILVVGAVLGWLCLRWERRSAVTLSVAAAAVLFFGALATWGTQALDRYKAPRPLVETTDAQLTKRDIRIGCFQYFQPSLVFYCRREVQRLTDERQTLEFLRTPMPVYLVLPAQAWQALERKVTIPYRQLARHYDLYRHCEIVIVSNQLEAATVGQAF
jgi:4-amino-4-deoxy-L-arabinose transferase-like glycosyltransferase